jgi:hypothetical protein
MARSLAQRQSARRSPRRSLGAILGNRVRFGTEDDIAIIGEGVETVLSLTCALLFLPMVAALSASHLSAWGPPPSLRHLIVARDGDLVGEEAARRLEERALSRHIAVSVIAPFHGDFNADLLRLGPKAFRERIVEILGPGIVGRSIDDSGGTSDGRR